MKMPSCSRSWLARLTLAVPLAVGTLSAGWLNAVPARANTFDQSAAEQQLINDINQDRAQHGLAALTVNPTLSSIARDAPHHVCGGGQTLHGRSQDMIERNYFSHQIPPCSQYVWPIMQSYGVTFTAAGENIGWNTYYPQSTSVDQMNTAFMKSPPHRANIMGAYNEVGVGAVAATGPWTYNGTSYSGVVMYTEIFAKGSVTGPPPTGKTKVSTNPAKVKHGNAVTVSWSGVANPTANDWFGLYIPGSADGTDLARLNTTGSASGSESFTVPPSVSKGKYEIRLYSGADSSRLATSRLAVTR
jgi:uncharacterized protein YkwD